ncbi:alpha/beta fold hydrolase [Dactylosporangium cerinum]
MRRLFLYVPAITGSRLLWEGLKARLETEPECQGDTFLSWPAAGRHLGKYSRGRTLEGYASNLSAHLAELDAAATARDSPYDEIILFGSSLGALVVRWAWLDGCGAFSGDALRPWAAKVTRIVLMAGINRGFSTRWESGRRSPRLLAEKLVISLASPFNFAWKDALAGAPFVTDLRLTWMRHLAEHPDRQPFVVQFLGASDRLVRREDSRDIEQFPRAAHVEVADAAHFDVLDVAGPDRDNRYLLLRSYILGAPDPTTPPPVTQEATEVVFVVHGIRAGVHGWVREVSQLVEDTGAQWRVVTPNYRYFSALAFAFPVTRRRKVRWFLDQYSGRWPSSRRRTSTSSVTATARICSAGRCRRCPPCVSVAYTSPAACSRPPFHGTPTCATCAGRLASARSAVTAAIATFRWPCSPRGCGASGCTMSETAGSAGSLSSTRRPRSNGRSSPAGTAHRSRPRNVAGTSPPTSPRAGRTARTGWSTATAGCSAGCPGCRQCSCSS